MRKNSYPGGCFNKFQTVIPFSINYPVKPGFRYQQSSLLLLLTKGTEGSHRADGNGRQSLL